MGKAKDLTHTVDLYILFVRVAFTFAQVLDKGFVTDKDSLRLTRIKAAVISFIAQACFIVITDKIMYNPYATFTCVFPNWNDSFKIW